MRQILFNSLYDQILSKESCFDLTKELSISETSYDSEGKQLDKAFKFKIPDNTNKFILVLSNEDDLINLFNLFSNNAIKANTNPSFSFAFNDDQLADFYKNTLVAIDGLSTHSIKYPDSSNSAQIYKEFNESFRLPNIIDSSDIYGKSKIFSKSATYISYARIFSVEFSYREKIISFVEVFALLDNYPKFKKYVMDIMPDLAEIISEKCKMILNGFIEEEKINTIITLPVGNEYINIVPTCSTKVLRKVQEYRYFSDEDHFILKNLIAVGGTQPQNVSDYNMYIGGNQSVLQSKIPHISGGFRKSLVKTLLRFNYKNSQNYFSNPNDTIDEGIKSKNEKYKKHCKNILSYSFKDSLSFEEKESINKSSFLKSIIKDTLNDIYMVCENIEFLANEFDFSKLSYNPYLMHFLVKFNVPYKHNPDDFIVDDKTTVYEKNIYELSKMVDKFNDYEDQEAVINDIVNEISKKIENGFLANKKKETILGITTDFTKELKDLIKKEIKEGV